MCVLLYTLLVSYIVNNSKIGIGKGIVLIILKSTQNFSTRYAVIVRKMAIIGGALLTVSFY